MLTIAMTSLQFPAPTFEPVVTYVRPCCILSCLFNTHGIDRIINEKHLT